MAYEPYRFVDIDRCTLAPPGASGKPFGLRFIRTRRGRNAMASRPAGDSASDLARVIADRGVVVESMVPPPS